MPRACTPRELVTPREPLTPTPQADHPPPILEGLPWSRDHDVIGVMSTKPHQPVARLNAFKKASNIDAESSPLLSILMTNFASIHSSHELMLSKLQSLVDEGHPSTGGAHHRTSCLSGYSSQAEYLKPSRANLPKRNSDCNSPTGIVKTVSHSSRTDVHALAHPDSGLDVVRDDSDSRRTSKTSHSPSMQSAGSNRGAIGQLSRIIAKHSKFQRRGAMIHKVWEFLENRTSSRWAYCYNTYLAPFFLTVSVIISFLQTVDDHTMPDQGLSAVQTSFELWFALEISVRFVACPNKLMFWFQIYNWIDLISVAPLVMRIYFLARDMDGDEQQATNVLALVPMLRLLKILRRFHKFQLLISAFSIALEALPVLIFSLMLIAIMFSGLVYLAEPRDLIADMPSALWFVMVTMTTVGYGDIVPETVLGKACSVILMILSALYMALPIGIVGNAFSEVWNDRDRLLLLAVLRESFTISGISRPLIREIFAYFNDDMDEDTYDPDPEMTLEDFVKMIRALQIDVSEDRVVALFNALDEDGGGTISCDEFIHKLFPVHFLHKRHHMLTSTWSTFTGTCNNSSGSRVIGSISPSTNYGTSEDKTSKVSEGFRSEGAVGRRQI